MNCLIPVKKAYHKISLQVHPDRVKNDEKEEATEKFKVLGRIHSILADKEKRKTYDQFGHIEDEDSDENAMKDWAAYWRMLFKEITIQDINDYEKNYKNSETEYRDLKKAYIGSKGNMDYILENVPFTSCEDEPRLHEIVKKMLDAGEVEEYHQFFNERESKKQRRRKKWEKEAEEAKRLDEALKLEKEDTFEGHPGNDENDLAVMIRKKQEERAGSMNNFFDMLADKYANPKSKKKNEAEWTPPAKRRKTVTPKSTKGRKSSPTKSNRRSPRK